MGSDDLVSMRAYRPTEGRQQRNDKLVHDVVELRRAIQDGAQIGRPLNVRLAATIMLDGPITIPAALPAFTLNGGGNFGFLWPQSIASVFIVAGSTTAATITDCTFDTAPNANAQASALVSAIAGVTVNGLRLRNLDVHRVVDVLDPTVDWVSVTASDLRLRGSVFHQMALRATTGSIVSSNFANVLGSCTVVFPASSTSNKLVNFNDAITGLAALQSEGGNSFVGVTFGGSVTLGATDLFVGGPDAPAQFPTGVDVGLAASTPPQEVATTNGTATPVATYSIAANTSALMTFDVVGRKTNGSNESNAYRLMTKAKNNGGTVSVIGGTVIFAVEDVAAWATPTITVVGTSVVVGVQGQAGDTVEWVCQASIQTSP